MYLKQLVRISIAVFLVAVFGGAQSVNAALVTTVDVGEASSCSLSDAGAVQCWGSNSFGQLGDGTLTQSLVPVAVNGLGSGVVAIAAGQYHACALNNAGAVKCWGYNGFGQLGDGTGTDRLAPVSVSDLGSGVIAIAAGQYHTCAVSNTGAATCWGRNNLGQLGDGSVINSPTPVLVSGLGGGVTSIAAGMHHSCALTDTGAVKCWGRNTNGQLGDTTTTDSLVPVAVSGLSAGVTGIATGFHHTCAVTNVGAVLCWGWNIYGQLGEGTTTNSSIPLAVSGLGSGVAEVAAGGDTTCTLTTAGAAQCWGLNSYGQLGNGTLSNSSIPVAVNGLNSGMASITVGFYHACASSNTGIVQCWGRNQYGQLGDGTTTDQVTPVFVVADTDGDGIADNVDNCPSIANADQLNTDGDAQGDVCDSDDDSDGVADVSDRFPLDPSEWLDTDNDGVGNNADIDDDNDGVPDVSDIFPLDASESIDADVDGVGDNADNCVDVANADQLNADGDAQGDACDIYPDDPLLLLQHDGAAKNEKLGGSVALADMNNDGVVDLLVGSPMANVVRSGKILKKAGQIQIISGKDNSVLRTISGSAANEQLGAAIAVIADQNNDGVLDIVVGNPIADVTTLTPDSFPVLKDAGRVMLYSGSDGRMLLILGEGAHAGDHFGASVAAADVNSDGKVDLVVGAPHADVAAKDAGQVTVFNGLGKTVLYSRNGAQVGENFGASLAMDNSYLFIGAPLYDSLVATNTGRLAIFNKNEGSSAALLAVSGEAKGDNFGAAVSAANGNWVVGVPLADSAGKDAGSVQIFSGLNTTPVNAFTGATVGDNFGSALNMQGDVNKDGKNDIAIGSAKFDVNTVINSKTALLKEAGRVEVLSGAGF